MTDVVRVHPLRGNPVFWMIWALLGAAVTGSFITLAIALRSADRQLPASYHWEGAGLDADFARLERAAVLGVQLQLRVGAEGMCTATLTGAAPAALELGFASSSAPSEDRLVRLTRAGSVYRGACDIPARGRWRLSVESDAREWALRASVEGPIRTLDLRARAPGAGA